MSAATVLLARLHAHGIEVRAAGDSLRYRPQGALTRALVAELAAHKHLILAHLAANEPAVAWRVAAMRAQLPASGPLPFLIARGTPRRADGCLRCGDPLATRTEGLAVCCAPCVHAAQLVTAEYMNGGQPA